MKKFILILCLILYGCTIKPVYHLDVYYASSCPVCRSFMKNVIPLLEEEYGNTMEIQTFNIDEESSIELYAKTCSLLEDYYVTDDSGSVPFIVLDGYFARVGYELGGQDEMVQMIKDAIEGKEINKTKDIYYFKENQSLY